MSLFGLILGILGVFCTDYRGIWAVLGIFEKREMSIQCEFDVILGILAMLMISLQSEK